jgi:cation diffusion facilitator CzcD-associated flavoprotein CzcO
MEAVAQEFGVTRLVRFNTAVADLIYENQTWHLTTADGEQEFFDVVISASGILNQPVYPNIEGLDSFKGDCFHSAQWDHTVDLTGKRVGIIGTGSTASQIIGAVTDKVDAMYVFQRTPQWLAPLPQKKYSSAWNGLMKYLPFMQRLAFHFYFQTILRTFGSATVGSKFMQKRVSKLCRKNLEDNVPDPELRARLTPDYQAACKRLIFCSDFYPAISRKNAHLITASITRVTENGIETADGKVHELDTLVLATGFNPAAFILPTHVTGENGVDLAQRWDGSPRAHRAVAVPGFPNFWLLEGPTGPVGNLSLITISEYQVDYVISMLDRMKNDGLSTIAAKDKACSDYNNAMSEAVTQTVWVTGGCNSWYMDKSGSPNLYPWIPSRYLKEMHNPDYSEYHLIK